MQFQAELRLTQPQAGLASSPIAAFAYVYALHAITSSLLILPCTPGRSISGLPAIVAVLHIAFTLPLLPARVTALLPGLYVLGACITDAHAVLLDRLQPLVEVHSACRVSL